MFSSLKTLLASRNLAVDSRFTHPDEHGDLALLAAMAGPIVQQVEAELWAGRRFEYEREVTDNSAPERKTLLERLAVLKRVIRATGVVDELRAQGLSIEQVHPLVRIARWLDRTPLLMSAKGLGSAWTLPLWYPIALGLRPIKGLHHLLSRYVAWAGKPVLTLFEMVERCVHGQEGTYELVGWQGPEGVGSNLSLFGKAFVWLKGRSEDKIHTLTSNYGVRALRFSELDLPSFTFGGPSRAQAESMFKTPLRCLVTFLRHPLAYSSLKPFPAIDGTNLPQYESPNHPAYFLVVMALTVLYAVAFTALLPITWPVVLPYVLGRKMVRAAIRAFAQMNRPAYC